MFSKRKSTIRYKIYQNNACCKYWRRLFLLRIAVCVCWPITNVSCCIKMQSWSACHRQLATVNALKVLSAVGGMWMVGAIYTCATSACCCSFGPITSQGNGVIMEARWTRSCDEPSIYTLHVLPGISCMGLGTSLLAYSSIPVTYL